MGVSVFNAAITTIGSSVVLMLSYIIFFQRFGIFVFMNIFYSTAFAFVFLMAILMVMGPIQGAGRMMKKDKGAGDPTADNETANPVLDDGDVADT